MQCTLTALPVTVAESVAYIVFNWFTHTVTQMEAYMHAQLLMQLWQSRCRQVMQTVGTPTFQNTTVVGLCG